MIDFLFFDTVYDRRNTNSIKYGKPPVKSSESVIPMWIADMDFKSPPAVVKALTETAEYGIYGYGNADEEYDALIIDWYKRRMGWSIKSESLIKVPGVMFGAAAAIRALTEKNDAVIICQPVYYPFEKIIKNNNRKVVVSELVLNNGRYEIDFDDFEMKIKQEKVKAFLFCSPHNPVGRVWSREELLKIAQICENNDVYIISDEIHSDFVFKGYKHIPIASLSNEISKRTITCISPTKTFNLAGIQAASIVVENRVLKQKIQKECASTGYSNLNIMALSAVKAAYKDGEQWLDTLLQYLQNNIAYLKNEISNNVSVSLINTEGTYLAWLDCRKLNINNAGLDNLFLNQAGVWLHNGATFGNAGKGFMRMNVACPYSVLKEAVKRINAVVDKNKNS
ncbi:MAG: MalY/PatB family protein [Acutalibacteraceae bacterium]